MPESLQWSTDRCFQVEVSENIIFNFIQFQTLFYTLDIGVLTTVTSTWRPNPVPFINQQQVTKLLKYSECALRKSTINFKLKTWKSFMIQLILSIHCSRVDAQWVNFFFIVIFSCVLEMLIINKSYST